MDLITIVWRLYTLLAICYMPCPVLPTIYACIYRAPYSCMSRAARCIIALPVLIFMAWTPIASVPVVALS